MNERMFFSLVAFGHDTVKRLNIAFLPAVLCLVLACADVFAYLDPATGSIILQGILAGLAGVMLTARIYWARLKNFFQKKSKASSEQE